VTNEQREAAIEAATQQLGTAKAVADKAKVTYTELRSWVRGRHEEFSKKGESRRARMIEDALRSLVSGSGHTRS
jgi:DNA-binding transcriptional regulator YdaS (Cro superfamily)